MNFTDGDTDILFEAEQSPVDGVLVKVSVNNEDYNYSGKCEDTASVEDWSSFIQELEELDLSRNGSAKLSAPGINILFKSLDLTGTIGVSGNLNIGLFSLTFEPVTFDTTNFSKFVTSLKSVEY